MTTTSWQPRTTSWDKGYSRYDWFQSMWFFQGWFSGPANYAWDWVQLTPTSTTWADLPSASTTWTELS